MAQDLVVGQQLNIMNSVQDDHEENNDEVIRETTTRNFPFSPSSSRATSKYRSQEPAAIPFDKKLELLDLSLGGNNNEYQSNIGSPNSRSIEKEHMFDKVVTPSDVGKLNRLVIPKQHAEKYFPLSSSNEKGLLLNFEDRNGKSWRFRYSYWNSSQSYVMTKGWSRFVKEKKLDAGDTVSFQRGVGESEKDMYYIDWKRRPNVPDPTTLAHIQLQSQFNYPQSVRWGSLYSVPQTPICMSRNYEPLHRLNYSIYPYSHRQQPQHQLQRHQGNVGQYYHPRSSSSGSRHHQIGAVLQYGRGDQPMVIDSVPVVQGTKKTVAKRLRLFGVNMECPTQDGSSSSFPRVTIGSDESPRSSNNSNNDSPQSGMQAEYSKKGKSSLSFDLDLCLKEKIQ